MSSRYQVTLPKRVRKNLKIKGGDRVLFIPTREQGYLLEVIKVPDEPLAELEGILSDLEVGVEEARSAGRTSHIRRKLKRIGAD